MTSWKRGRDLLLARWKQDSLPLAPFLARLPQSRTIRVPGMAVFLTGKPDYVPTSLLHNLKHNKVLHERVLFVTVQNVDVPEIAPARRTEVSELAAASTGSSCATASWRARTFRASWRTLPQPASLSIRCRRATSWAARCWCPATVPKLPWWRLWLFLVMARNAVPATEFFRIPNDRVVELGVRIAI